MKKSEIIEEFIKEKKNHQFQNSKIATLFSNPTANSPTPKDKTECRFGKWLYSNEEYFIKLIGPLFFQNIELYHAQWHKEYKKIYDIFYEDGHRARTISQMNLDKAKLYLTEINECSQEFTNSMNMSLKRLNALNERNF